MSVMPAGVHVATMLTRVRQARFFLNGQRIDISPQRDAWLGWISDHRDRRRRRIGHAVDMFDPQ